jgi:hypothetical protein
MKLNTPKDNPNTKPQNGQQSRSSSVPSVGESSREGAKRDSQNGASQFTEQDRAESQEGDDGGVGAKRKPSSS